MHAWCIIFRKSVDNFEISHKTCYLKLEVQYPLNTVNHCYTPKIFCLGYRLTFVPLCTITYLTKLFHKYDELKSMHLNWFVPDDCKVGHNYKSAVIT